MPDRTVRLNSQKTLAGKAEGYDAVHLLCRLRSIGVGAVEEQAAPGPQAAVLFQGAGTVGMRLDRGHVVHQLNGRCRIFVGAKAQAGRSAAAPEGAVVLQDKRISVAAGHSLHAVHDPDRGLNEISGRTVPQLAAVVLSPHPERTVRFDKTGVVAAVACGHDIVRHLYRRKASVFIQGGTAPPPESSVRFDDGCPAVFRRDRICKALFCEFRTCHGRAGEGQAEDRYKQ